MACYLIVASLDILSAAFAHLIYSTIYCILLKANIEQRSTVAFINFWKTLKGEFV